MKTFKPLFALFVLFVLAPVAVFGQECSAVVQQALNRAATVCANLEANTVCYGAGVVSAEFNTADGEAAIVWEEGARAPLDRLVSVTGSAFDGSSMGIVLISAQYNLPSGAGSANLIALGDVALTNNVARDAAFLPTGLSVTVAQTTDLLRFPPNFGTEVSRVVGVAATGETYTADAVSADGAFVRVAYEFQEVGEAKRRATAWVSVDSLQAFDTASLAVLTADTYAPLQDMAVVLGDAEVACAAATNMILVTSPDDIKTEFVLNGTDVTIASTVAYAKSKGAVRYVVLEGCVEATLPNGQVVLACAGDVIQTNANGEPTAVVTGQGDDELLTYLATGAIPGFEVDEDFADTIGGASGIGR